MSALSTFVNNFDLILEHRDLVLSHAPYRFSRVTFPVLGKRKASENSSYLFKGYLGSYLYVWDNYKNRWPDGDLIPLRVTGSLFSGRIASFLGYSRSRRELVRQQPDGFTTGCMLGPIRDFNQNYPGSTLALPLEKVIEELKSELPITSTEGYSLLTLADEFYDTLHYITGISNDGPERITYKLKQDLAGKPVVQIGAVLEIKLTPDERRRATWNGFSVHVAEIVQGGKLKLVEVAKQYGFSVTETEQGNVAESHLSFATTLSDFDAFLETETLNHIAGFLHQVTKLCRRF